MAIDYTVFAFAKQPKGSVTLERRAKRAQTVADEKAVKAAVTARDGARVCRLDPNCEYVKKGIRVEGCHLDAKGMAGDHGVRTQVELMVRGCLQHHQGADSLHAGTRRLAYLTDAKANGPIAMERRTVEIDAATGDRRVVWAEFAREKAVGVWMTAREFAARGER